jgi:hypothetical protein
MKELVKSPKLLNQSDRCVEIIAQENGEHRDVHFQRWIEDLVQR